MLHACVASAHPDNLCVAACRLHFAAGGTRLRARICMDAADRLGLDHAISLQLASACELLHNASLIQDDLLDRAPLRRGQPSVWARFGDGVAVCTGDLALAAAYACIADLNELPVFRLIFNLVHRRTQEVILGQTDELAAAHSGSTTVLAYEALAQSKSASLLSLCLELPLCAAGYSVELSIAQQVTAYFSIAYQIADDLEDVEQDRLSHSINFVDVLSCSEQISLVEARERAAWRAEELLRSAVDLARELPFDCAAVLVEHAKSLIGRLAPVPVPAYPAKR